MCSTLDPELKFKCQIKSVDTHIGVMNVEGQINKEKLSLNPIRNSLICKDIYTPSLLTSNDGLNHR